MYTKSVLIRLNTTGPKILAAYGKWQPFVPLQTLQIGQPASEDWISGRESTLPPGGAKTRARKKKAVMARRARACRPGSARRYRQPCGTRTHLVHHSAGRQRPHEATVSSTGLNTNSEFFVRSSMPATGPTTCLTPPGAPEPAHPHTPTKQRQLSRFERLRAAPACLLRPYGG